MRAYKSGTTWCFWRWTEVPSNYILRLHLLKTPWFAICVHWLNAPDPEPCQHDHPVTFLSVILRGGYTERRKRDYRVHRWFNWITASSSDPHTIIDVKPRTVTLCFMGPKIREWGFHTRSGWVGWKIYNATKYGSA